MHFTYYIQQVLSAIKPSRAVATPKDVTVYGFNWLICVAVRDHGKNGFTLGAGHSKASAIRNLMKAYPEYK